MHDTTYNRQRTHAMRHARWPRLPPLCAYPGTQRSHSRASRLWRSPSEGWAESRRRCGNGEPSPGADVGSSEPSPGADVAAAEPSPGADVAAVSPVPVQMWQRPSPVPAQMWQRPAPVPAQMWAAASPSPGADVGSGPSEQCAQTKLRVAFGPRRSAVADGLCCAKARLRPPSGDGLRQNVAIMGR